MRVTILLAVLILAAGCSGGPSTGASAPTSPSTPAPPSVVTTTPPATSTTVAEPVEIPGRSLVWEPGTYTTNRFLVPVTFSVDVPGWRSYGAEDAWVMLGYLEERGSDTGATLVVLAYRPQEPVEVLIDAITSIEGVLVLSDPSPKVIGEFDTVALDVEGAPDPTQTGARIRDCSDPAGSGRFFLDGPGYVLLTEGINGFGIPACYRSRVWVVGVDGTTVTMIATTEDAEDFERLMAAAEQLLDGLQFQAGG